MEKYFEKWNGMLFPVRVIPLPEDLGYGSPVNVASRELWNFIEYDVYEGNKDAEAIDNNIFFYIEPSLFDLEPTDKELADYVIKYLF